MLDRKYTVYFDTQFYVQLCHADKAKADHISRTLNALNVRHVISQVLIRELLTSRNRAELDEVLVHREKDQAQTISASKGILNMIGMAWVFSIRQPLRSWKNTIGFRTHLPNRKTDRIKLR
jgi:hypothetical protein